MTLQSESNPIIQDEFPFHNPLTQGRNSLDRTRLVEAFPDLQLCSKQHFLALRRYLDQQPERFFDKTTYDIYLNWLQKRDASNSEALMEHLSQFNDEINRALLSLREINSEKWHDKQLIMTDEYELIRFVDRQVHRAYLRLSESVLVPLSRIIAHFSRLDRGKETDGLDAWSIMEELKEGPMDHIFQSYRHIIRNGIGHGGITFLNNEIRYRDKKGNEEVFHTKTVVRLFDSLLDTCNGLAAAIKLGAVPDN